MLNTGMKLGTWLDINKQLQLAKWILYDINWVQRVIKDRDLLKTRFVLKKVVNSKNVYEN